MYENKNANLQSENKTVLTKFIFHIENRTPFAKYSTFKNDSNMAF